MDSAPARLARFFDPEGRLRLGRVEGGVLQPMRGDLFGALSPIGEPVPVSAVRLLSPVLPSKIIIVHTDGMLSLKPSTAVIGPGQPVVLPDGVDGVRAHACIAAVISRTLTGPSGAAGHLLGETALADVVAPDRERLLGGGGYDTFCPLGPWIQTGVRATVVEAVARVAAVLTLYPGDVVALRDGTVMDAAAGDRLRIATAGLEVLENPVVDGACDD